VAGLSRPGVRSVGGARRRGARRDRRSGASICPTLSTSTRALCAPGLVGRHIRAGGAGPRTGSSTRVRAGERGLLQPRPIACGRRESPQRRTEASRFDMSYAVRGRASCRRDGMFEHCLSTTSATDRITSIRHRRARRDRRPRCCGRPDPIHMHRSSSAGIAGASPARRCPRRPRPALLHGKHRPLRVN
jgi:hypothetical protein